MINAPAKLAKLLRVPEKMVQDIEAYLHDKTKKNNVIDDLARQNRDLINQSLQALMVSGLKAEEVFQGLNNCVAQTDKALFRLFPSVRPDSVKGCRSLVKSAQELAGPKPGFFLSEYKAISLILKNPPLNIIHFLGYANERELLDKEEVWEIFAGLRFLEDEAWLNKVFFAAYHDLTADDFEKRPIKVEVLDEKWAKLAQRFVKQKLHHISHLKELGLVFVIPCDKFYSGQILEIFSLVLHYLHEIDFYSQLFVRGGKQDNFGLYLTKLLRGDISAEPIKHNGSQWRIVGRYLAKKDAQHPFLYEPHLNPEALHWLKAENDIARLSQRFSQIGLDFWHDLDWVGDYFVSPEQKKPELISFDLVDNLISLTKQSSLLDKYLYHQQEALWNKIFMQYFGLRGLEKSIMENMDSGIVNI